MKDGSGRKDREDKLIGIEIHITEVFVVVEFIMNQENES
jgi:hypothetical protein